MMNESGKIEGRGRGPFESWDYEEQAISVLGCNNRPEKARVDVTRPSKIFLSSIWQPKRERLAIENRSDRNHAPFSLGHLVHDPTSTACNA